MRDPLFHDGWRDPGDDLHRSVFYVAWVLGFLGGFSLSIYSVGLMARHGVIQVETWPGYHSPIPGLPIWLLILGLLTMLRTGLKLYPEIRKIRRKHLRADAFIAGGFLAGVAMILLGLERIMWAEGPPGSLAGLVIAGVVVVVASLFTGLLIAFLPKLTQIPRTVSNTLVESRYGIDKRQMEIYDHPNPADEDCIPMVQLKTPDGKVLTLKAGAVAYDLAAPGMRGTARIAGSRLRSFHPSRRV
jgi:hypothetical protein